MNLTSSAPGAFAGNSLIASFDAVEIDNCPVCDPIRKLTEQFIARKYHIVQQRVDDPHFRQVYLRLSGPKASDLPAMPGTVQVQNKYICDCHWSTLEFMEEK